MKLKSIPLLSTIVTLNVLLVTLSLSKCYADTAPTIKCNPSRATVYLSGAQLFYSQTVQLAAGVTDLSFSGVSPYLDPATIITGGKGNFTILDAQFNTRYPENIETKADNPLLLKYQKQIKVKQDSSYELYYQLSLIQAHKDALAVEKEFLQNNPIIKGTAKKDSLALVKDAFDYFRQRQANIDEEWNKLLRQQDKLTSQKAQLETDIQNINQLIAKVQSGEPDDNAQPVYEIIISVSADAATAATIEFSYYTASASWVPEYDLKASSTSTGITLIQKARLIQNTYVDWKNIKLTLSTGNPALGNTRPQLNPCYITLVNYIREESLNYKSVETPVTTGNTISLFDKNEDDAKFSYDYASVQQNMVQVEYTIDLAYNIPSDNKPHNIAIQKKDIDAQFQYYCIPKLDKDAFLQARISDWEDMNLIYGEAKIYFDNSFVGKSYINPNDLDDTLNIDLGRDKTILVERKLEKEKSKTGFLDGNKIVSRNYTITLRNTKMSNVSIMLFDQLPLSQQKDITVTADETGGAAYTESTGLLAWNMNLKSKDTRTVHFGFTIKYPSSIEINPVL